MSVNNIVPFTFSGAESALIKGLHKPAVLQDYSFNVQNAPHGRITTPEAREQIERVKALAETFFLNCVAPAKSEGLLDDWRTAFERLYVVRGGLNDADRDEFNAFLKHAINLNSVVWYV